MVGGVVVVRTEGVSIGDAGVVGSLVDEGGISSTLCAHELSDRTAVKRKIETSIAAPFIFAPPTGCSRPNHHHAKGRSERDKCIESV